MSFKNHGPGGCCCGNCCLDWSQFQSYASRYGYTGPVPAGNDYTTCHPQFGQGWELDRDPNASSTRGPWSTAKTPPGGSYKGLGIYCEDDYPIEWPITAGSTVSFDMSFSEEPASFGVFVGQISATTIDSWLGPRQQFQSNDGYNAYIDVSGGKISVTPVSGFSGGNGLGYAQLSNYLAARSRDDGGMLATLQPTLLNGGDVQDFLDAGGKDIFGIAGTCVIPYGTRVELPEYDGSGKVSVRVEMGGRLRGYTANAFYDGYHVINLYVNDYLVHTTFCRHVHDSGSSIQYYSAAQIVAAYAGWRVGSAQDCVDNFKTLRGGTGVSAINGESRYDNQGWAEPNPNTVYTVSNTEVCYNAYSSRVVQSVYPGSACPSSQGPVCKAPCPGEVEILKYGQDAAAQPDFVEEGSRDSKWYKTTYGYDNANLIPRSHGFQTTLNGANNQRVYWNSPFTEPHFGNHSDQNRYIDPVQNNNPALISNSITYDGLPYIVNVTDVQVRREGNKQLWQLGFRMYYDGELAPPGAMTHAGWYFYIERFAGFPDDELVTTIGPSYHDYSLWSGGQGYRGNSFYYDTTWADRLYEAVQNDGTGWKISEFI